MNEEFHVCWKGQTLGPFTRQEIERQLLSGEITLLHAIRCDGELVDSSKWLHSLRALKTPAAPSIPLPPQPPPPEPKVPEAPQVPHFSPPYAPPPQAQPGGDPMGQTPDTASPPWLPPPPSPPPIPPNFSHFPNPAYTPQPPPLPHQRTISNPKSRVAFVLLGLFLGFFGIHNFYAGYTSKAITQLLLVLLLCWTCAVPLGVAIWVIVEVITVKHDAEGNKLS